MSCSCCDGRQQGSQNRAIYLVLVATGGSLDQGPQFPARRRLTRIGYNEFSALVSLGQGQTMRAIYLVLVATGGSLDRWVLFLLRREENGVRFGVGVVVVIFNAAGYDAMTFLNGRIGSYRYN